MIKANDLRVGDTLQSLNPRDNGRVVRVTSIDGDWIRIRNLASGRRGQLRAPLHRWEFATTTTGQTPDASRP